MNALLSHKDEFEAGIVAESGFTVIGNAESYAAASSIGAGSLAIAKLWKAFQSGRNLTLYCKDKSTIEPLSEDELVAWCEKNFPACYREYRRREKQ